MVTANARDDIRVTALSEHLGGEIAGCAFVIELDELNGRKKLSNYRVHSLLHY